MDALSKVPEGVLLIVDYPLFACYPIEGSLDQDRPIWHRYPLTFRTFWYPIAARRACRNITRGAIYLSGDHRSLSSMTAGFVRVALVTIRPSDAPSECPRSHVDRTEKTGGSSSVLDGDPGIDDAVEDVDDEVPYDHEHRYEEEDELGDREVTREYGRHERVTHPRPVEDDLK